MEIWTARQETAEGAALARSLAAARTTERLTEVRYCAGAVSLLSWLAALGAPPSGLAANELAQLENYVTLCQALGGGADHL